VLLGMRCSKCRLNGRSWHGHTEGRMGPYGGRIDLSAGGP